MKSITHVAVLGHLAADPELRETKTGKSVANFSVAVNRNSKDENGKKKELTDYHRIVAWNRSAKLVDQYLAKGAAVYVQGRLVNNHYDDSSGNRHYNTEIVMDQLVIITWKKGKSGQPEMAMEKVTATAEEEELVAA